MLTFDWITLWILGPTIGFGTFILLTMIFVMGRKRFRSLPNISFLGFSFSMLAVSITAMVIYQQTDFQSAVSLTATNSTEPVFLIFSLLILATSILYTIFIEFEVSGHVQWIRMVVISGGTALILATLADVGYLSFFPINQISQASGWISAIYLLSAFFFLASSISFFRRSPKDYRFLGLSPLILLVGLSLNMLLFGSILASSIAIGFMYIGLSSAMIFEGLVSPTAGRIEEVYSLNQELSDAYSSTLEGWAKALELRDKETVGHSRRVTDLAVKLAKALGLTEKELQDVHFGALLHDIGKMAIPDKILNKPGKLSTGERAIMETHPEEGYKLLEHIDYLNAAAMIALYHHEKYDGSGYPKGIAGEEIPYIARLFAIVDVWDAITSERPYAAAWPIPMARAYLKEEKGVSFDPEIVDAFLKLDETYKQP